MSSLCVAQVAVTHVAFAVITRFIGMSVAVSTGLRKPPGREIKVFARHTTLPVALVFIITPAVIIAKREAMSSQFVMELLIKAEAVPVIVGIVARILEEEI